MTNEDQRALAGRVKNGDSSAEEELVRWFGPRVLIMLRARTRETDAARDLCQDVLMAVLSAVREGHLRDGDRLAAFVHGIARNTANNYIRTRCREPVLTELVETVRAAASTDPVETIERRQLVARALASVGRQDRRILRLTLIDGLQPREIASRLGLSRDVVRARKTRALRKLIARVRGPSRT